MRKRDVTVGLLKPCRGTAMPGGVYRTAVVQPAALPVCDSGLSVIAGFCKKVNGNGYCAGGL